MSVDTPERPTPVDAAEANVTLSPKSKMVGIAPTPVWVNPEDENFSTPPPRSTVPRRGFLKLAEAVGIIGLGTALGFGVKALEKPDTNIDQPDAPKNWPQESKQPVKLEAGIITDQELEHRLDYYLRPDTRDRVSFRVNMLRDAKIFMNTNSQGVENNQNIYSQILAERAKRIGIDEFETRIVVGLEQQPADEISLKTQAFKYVTDHKLDPELLNDPVNIKSLNYKWVKESLSTGFGIKDDLLAVLAFREGYGNFMKRLEVFKKSDGSYPTNFSQLLDLKYYNSVKLTEAQIYLNQVLLAAILS